MSDNAVCPVCDNPQDQGLACHSCCERLERDLGDVSSIVADLDVTLSRQDRVPSAGGRPVREQDKKDDAGLSAIAHTRTPVHWGASTVADELASVLTRWAEQVLAVRLLGHERGARFAAALLLNHINEIRRHPEVVKLVDQTHAAIGQARRVVDRPADRVYLGQCMYEEGDVTCYEDLYASPGASEVRCKVCGVTHPVAERRAWLMQRAEDMLFTPAEASQMLGEVGHITVSQASIRSYIHRGRILYRPPVADKRFRLGDLLDILRNETSERRTA